MTVPVTAWMLLREMGRRNTAEMAATMVVPVVPFLFLVWFDVTAIAPCGAYCIVTIATMYGLIRFRRSDYSADRRTRSVFATAPRVTRPSFR